MPQEALLITRRSILAGLAVTFAVPAVAGPPGRGGQGRGPARMPGVPAGVAAPDFALNDIDTGEVIQLSQIYGEKPVVLVFGSFT